MADILSWVSRSYSQALPAFFSPTLAVRKSPLHLGVWPLGHNRESAGILLGHIALTDFFKKSDKSRELAGVALSPSFLLCMRTIKPDTGLSSCNQ